MPSNDPEYQKRYIKQHYQNNKEYYAKKARERDARVKPYLTAFVSRYKLWKGCIDCGYKKHPHALHFDHLHSKIKPVSYLVAEKQSLTKIKDEIRKCEVRCANCHAVKTAERRALSC